MVFSYVELSIHLSKQTNTANSICIVYTLNWIKFGVNIENKGKHVGLFTNMNQSSADIGLFGIVRGIKIKLSRLNFINNQIEDNWLFKLVFLHSCLLYKAFGWFNFCQK